MHHEYMHKGIIVKYIRLGIKTDYPRLLLHAQFHSVISYPPVVPVEFRHVEVLVVFDYRPSCIQSVVGTICLVLSKNHIAHRVFHLIRWHLWSPYEFRIPQPVHCRNPSDVWIYSSGCYTPYFWPSSLGMLTVLIPSVHVCILGVGRQHVVSILML